MTAVDVVMAWLQRHRHRPGDKTINVYLPGWVAWVSGTLLVLAVLTDRGGRAWSVAELSAFTGLSDAATRQRLQALAAHRGLAVYHGRRGGWSLDVEALRRAAAP